jgi:hypothetical protein
MHPRFLCIGAQKAGTTWLHRNLETHPDIWLPPVKELHYFDDGAPGGVVPAFRRNLQRLHHKDARRNVVFLSKLCFLPKTVRSYGRLFPDLEGKIPGEITPAYARLDEGIVGQLHGVMPEARIIYILRDPVERSWSQLVMRASRRGHTVEQIDGWSDAEVRDFILASRALENSDYEANLKKWRKFFGDDAVRVLFFEDVKERPEELLLEVFRFIGAEASEKYITAAARRKLHKGRYTKIPARIQSILAALHLEQIQKVHAYLGHGYTARWEETATALAKT